MIFLIIFVFEIQNLPYFINTFRMSIQAERSQIIEQINQINDIDLIRAIKNILVFASKKEKANEYVIPDWQKDIVGWRVRERINNYKPKDNVPWKDLIL